jgi:hypothetical protein
MLRARSYGNIRLDQEDFASKSPISLPVTTTKRSNAFAVVENTKMLFLSAQSPAFDTVFLL